MSLTAGIAWRYLWKKKSHGALSAIAIVSVTGVAVATAAIVCVLSVFNGFKDYLIAQNDRILPDIEITPAKGKVIAQGDSLAAAIAAMPGVEVATPIVTDQALAIYQSREMPVMLRGIVPDDFRRVASIDSLIAAGETLPSDPFAIDPPAALISSGTAVSLKAYSPGASIFIFAPRREGRINPANPISSFFTDSITTAGVIETGQNEIDVNSIYVPIEMARGLFQYDAEATSIAIKAAPGKDPQALAADIAGKIGAAYEVKDRQRQQEMSFRMVQIEKWVTSLLLLFILIIASFNIISTLTMFVLEKRRSISTLRALGMSRRDIGSIFGWESLYVTFIGAAAGVLLGLGLCLLQQEFGLIKMGGDPTEMVMTVYPVKIELSDLWIVALPILAIGLVTAWIASSFAKSRIEERRQ